MTAAAPDELLRTLSADGGVSVRALVGTQLVREATQRHATSPVATAALGRALLGAVLLASQGKDAKRWSCASARAGRSATSSRRPTA